MFPHVVRLSFVIPALFINPSILLNSLITFSIAALHSSGFVNSANA